jgi:hypothetical protein
LVEQDQHVAQHGVSEFTLDRWAHWQNEVVKLLRGFLHGELAAVVLEDIDWPSWQVYFVQGRSPQAAINLALERDS